MKIIILAGGSGTRLWPLSRREFPKQFLKLDGSRSFLQQTVSRLLPLAGEGDFVVVTNEAYKFHVIADLREMGEGLAANIILEPDSRNTAPAIGLAALYCREKLGCRDDEVLIVLPSDHVIRPEEHFREYVKKAIAAADGERLVTFGIRPSRPETGYGYIKAVPAQGRPRKDEERGYLPVERFTEKPDVHAAEKYLADGNYFWNSGIFVFRIGTILNTFRTLSPGVHQILAEGFEGAIANFSAMPNISIDYAVMEKARKVAVIPMDLEWSDIGSFDALFEFFDPDESGNVHRGDIIPVDTRNSLILGGERLIATVGLRDVVIIETPDAILISRKDETQRVRDVVNELRARGRREASEHRTTYRPWGSYTILEEGPRYKIKRITVNPGQRLSLQKHVHRSEHWVVVRGEARVTLDSRETTIRENESAFVPKSVPHRLENPGETLLEIIEVQCGEYVGEDDIIRFDDTYGRVHKESSA